VANMLASSLRLLSPWVSALFLTSALVETAAAQVSGPPLAAGDVWQGTVRCGGVESPMRLQVVAAGQGRSSDPAQVIWAIRGDVEATTRNTSVKFSIAGVLRYGQLSLRPVPAADGSMVVGAFGVNGVFRQDGRLLTGTAEAPGCEAYSLRKVDPATAASVGPVGESAATGRIATTAARTLTALDFLPQGVIVSEAECQQAGREVDQIARSLLFSGARQAQVEGAFQAVPPHWAALAQREPNLSQWVREVLPRGCPPRAALKAWLRSTGQSGLSIDDPRSAASAEPLLREVAPKLMAARLEALARNQAEEKLFKEQLAQRAQAEASNIASVDLETLVLGSPRQAVLQRLPQALCEISEKWARCERVDPCTPDVKSLRAAEERRIPPFGQAFRPSDQSYLNQQVSEAQGRLRRCQASYEVSAAFKSGLSYGTQSVRFAEFSFSDGSLTQLEFSGVSNGAALQQRLTDRFGLPLRRTETVPMMAAVNVTEQHVLQSWEFRSPWEKTGDLVERQYLSNEVVQVPTTVFIWRAPGIEIELNRGRLSMVRVTR
jgi:hypothetical protein